MSRSNISKTGWRLKMILAIGTFSVFAVGCTNGFSSAVSKAIDSVSIRTTTTSLTVKASPTWVAPGGTVNVTVSNGPGQTSNFIEAYQVEGTCGNYTCWKWLGDTYIKYLTSGNETVSYVMPATAGNYAFYFRYSSSTTTYVASNHITVSPPPTISSISPSSGAEAISPYPVIAGTNLQTNAKVYVNGKLARGMWYKAPSDIVFEPPLSAVIGPVNVKVVNPDGGYTIDKGGWSYTTASLATCSFNGKTLTYDQTVTAYEYSSVSYGSTCTSQTRQCISQNDLTGSYKYASCTVSSPSMTVTSVSPNSGPESIYPYPTITGSGFESGAQVYVNGIVARGAWGDSTGKYLVFEPPLSAVIGAVPVKVVNPDGTTATLANGFSYTTASLAKCTFNGQTLSYDQSVTAYLASSVPYGSTCTSQTRTCVSNNDLSGSYAYASCTVNAPTVTPPTISSISPNSGPASISPYPTITGSNFESGATVMVGGVAARGAWGESTGHYLTFEPPNVTTTGAVNVTVINPDGGQATLTNGWTYTTSSTSGSGSGTGSTSSGTDNFPRLGWIAIGGSQNYNSTFQSIAAKVHIVIVGGNWEGWNPGYTMDSVISSVHSQSKVGTRVFQYNNFVDQADSSSSAGDPTFWNITNNNNWWLYNSGSSGTKAADFWSSSWWGLDYAVNPSTGVPYAGYDSATGLTPYQTAAKFDNDMYHLGKYGQPADPALDGFFLDNVFTGGPGSQLDSGDWFRNGSFTSNTNTTVEAGVQAAEASFFKYLNQVWPGALQIGNSGDTMAMAIDNGVDVSRLKNVMNGGVYEGAIGENWSPETWGGPSAFMRWYQNSINMYANPKLEFVGHENVQSNGSDPISWSGSSVTSWSAPYQGMRYGLCATLMNDGYYSPSGSNYSDTYFPWFDEFDGGGLGTGYLGKPLSTSAGAPQTGAWQNGVWKREFQNGIVLWNPRGNGTQTVNLSGLGNLKHLTGGQNPSLNNGAAVTNGTVTLHDRDGLILLRY